MVQTLICGEAFAQPETLRVIFHKTGNMQYISHLDLVRTMTRVIIRSHIPVVYSEGFNPIPRLSFAAPLSVGVESVCEVMDIRITHPVDTAAVMRVLNENLSPLLAVYDVYMAEGKVKDIAFVTYTFRLTTERACTNFADTVQKTLTKRPLTVVKMTKAGEKETDISPAIHDLIVKEEDGTVRIDATLAVNNASFLNPDYLMKALERATGYPDPDKKDKEYYTIMRTGFYLQDGTPFR